MFSERGLDFFSQDEEQRHANEPTDDKVAALETKATVNQLSDGQTMESTPEALSNMRLEILPQLQYVQIIPDSYTTTQNRPVSHLVR